MLEGRCKDFRETKDINHLSSNQWARLASRDVDWTQLQKDILCFLQYFKSIFQLCTVILQRSFEVLVLPVYPSRQKAITGCLMAPDCRYILETLNGNERKKTFADMFLSSCPILFKSTTKQCSHLNIWIRKERKWISWGALHHCVCVCVCVWLSLCVYVGF